MITSRAILRAERKVLSSKNSKPSVKVTSDGLKLSGCPDPSSFERDSGKSLTAELHWNKEIQP